MLPATLVILAASNWGLAVGIGLVFLVFIVVGYVVVQGTRVQLAWRDRVQQGDVDAIRTLVSDEVARWKSSRMPKGMQPSLWRGIQSAEVADIQPDGVRLSLLAEGQYAVVGTERREVSNAFLEGVAVTAKVTDMVLYDIPNVRLENVQIDVYSTYRDEHGAAQRCIISTRATRTVGDTLDWDAMEPMEIVQSFETRFRLDERGNALPIDIDPPPPGSVPAAFYRDD